MFILLIMIYTITWFFSVTKSHFPLIIFSFVLLLYCMSVCHRALDKDKEYIDSIRSMK